MVVERLAGWIPVARTVVFAFVGECCVGRLEAPNMSGGRRYWIYLIAGDYWKSVGMYRGVPEGCCPERWEGNKSTNAGWVKDGGRASMGRWKRGVIECHGNLFIYLNGLPQVGDCSLTKR